MNKVIEKLASLINVKTIVTFVVIAIFAVLAIREVVEPQATMQIVTMVIAFYFGTQHEKKDTAMSAPAPPLEQGAPNVANPIGFVSNSEKDE